MRRGRDGSATSLADCWRIATGLLKDCCGIPVSLPYCPRRYSSA